MEYILLLLIILSNAMALTNLIHKKIELTIPIVVIGLTLVVYIMGLFDDLAIGVKIVEIISSISTIYNILYIRKAIKKKQIKKVCRRVFTPRNDCLYRDILYIYSNKSS